MKNSLDSFTKHFCPKCYEETYAQLNPSNGNKIRICLNNNCEDLARVYTKNSNSQVYVHTHSVPPHIVPELKRLKDEQ
jgi:hypothetical protein